MRMLYANFFLKHFFLCVYVCTCVCCDVHVEVRENLWPQLSTSTMWVPRVEFRWFGSVASAGASLAIFLAQCPLPLRFFSRIYH